MKSYDDIGRVCSCCGAYKKYADFHKHKDCVNGYNVVCKECRKIRSKEHYANGTLESRIYYRARNRARKSNIPFNIDISDIFVPEMCPVLNVRLVIGCPDYTPSIDRIIPQLGYTKGNVAIISNRANRIKSDATKEELEALLRYLKEKQC